MNTLIVLPTVALLVLNSFMFIGLVIIRVHIGRVEQALLETRAELDRIKERYAEWDH